MYLGSLSTLFYIHPNSFKKASSSFFFQSFFRNVIHSTSNKKCYPIITYKVFSIFCFLCLSKNLGKIWKFYMYIYSFNIDSCSSRYSRQISNPYMFWVYLILWFWPFFRYRAVVFPFKEKTSKRAVTGVMVLIWFGSSVLALPAYLFSSVWVILTYYKIYILYKLATRANF